MPGSKNRLIFIVFLFAFTIHSGVLAQNSPKREFRGVWIASVANIDWPSSSGSTPEKQRSEFREILNRHQHNGINVVIVQIRPNADALYRSSLEPWSEWLTGKMSKSPEPEYDPLTFMIEEAHERGMEFHAWLNPYRAIFDAKKFYAEPGHVRLDTLNKLITDLSNTDVTASGLSKKEYRNLAQLLELDTNLLVYRHPEWFVEYGNKIYFDPGIPEVQQHIYKVVGEIVKNYDVDAIHMDDYFYPYRIAGLDFPDNATFLKYGGQFEAGQKDDWRRQNVNTIVQNLHATIKGVKPFVKFGISPFGVWRNAATDPRGSATRAGQTNYDDLYADVLKWMQEKWIDYVIPQIYWHRGFDLADYEILAKWWNDNHYGVQVYIGHGLYRVDAASPTEAWRNPMEIPEQIELNRKLPNIQGSCFFSSKTMINNPLGVSDILRQKYYQLPALVPEMRTLQSPSAMVPQELVVRDVKDGFSIEWTKAQNTDYYLVYRFKGKKTDDFSDPANILALQRNTVNFFTDLNIRKFRKYTYAVTSLNRLFEESLPSASVTTKWKKFNKKP